MRKLLILTILSALASGAPLCAAQESNGASEKKVSESQKQVTPLRVQVVFSEYDGNKEISRFPYSFYVDADELPGMRPNTKIRSGARVPIATGSFHYGPGQDTASVANLLVNTQFQYLDVGTNIDCGATTDEDGRYKIALIVERSYIAPAPGTNSEKAGEGSQEAALPSQPNPIIRSFRADFTLLMRDGQTIDDTMATDPLNGHVFRISVTANKVK